MWLGVLACGGGEIDEIPGFVMADYLPLDGDRRWELEADDDGALLRVDLQAGPDDGPRHLLHFDPDTGRRLLDLELASDPSRGVEVHGWRIHDDAPVLFDDPLLLLPSRMAQDDVHSDEVGGVAIEVVFGGLGICENGWVEDAWECVLLDIDAPGTPLDGHFELAPVYGFSVWQRTDDPAPWRLRRAFYEG